MSCMNDPVHATSFSSTCYGGFNASICDNEHGLDSVGSLRRLSHECNRRTKKGSRLNMDQRSRRAPAHPAPYLGRPSLPNPGNCRSGRLPQELFGQPARHLKGFSRWLTSITHTPPIGTHNQAVMSTSVTGLATSLGNDVRNVAARVVNPATTRRGIKAEHVAHVVEMVGSPKKPLITAAPIATTVAIGAMGKMMPTHH